MKPPLRCNARWRLHPTTSPTRTFGTLLYFQARYPEALSAFERAVALGANNYMRWGNMADAARMTAPGSEKMHEGYTRAVQLGQQQLSKDPDNTEIRSSVAVYLIRNGQPQQALAELDRILAQKTVLPAVLFKCALVAEIAGQRNRALDLLGRALAAGYQLGEIRQEPDFVKLRTDPEYHKLASRYEK
jgi:tetratricopeptide (TPR) repeat protein